MAKLSFFDRMRKQQILGKLNRDLNFSDYKKLNDSLKNDEDVQKMALYCVKNLADFQVFSTDFLIKNIGKYPDDIQELCFRGRGKVILKYLSHDVQVKVIDGDPMMLQYANDNLQGELVIKDSNLFPYLSPDGQIELLKKNPKLMQSVNKDLLEELVIKDSNLLSYLSVQEQSNLVLKHQELFSTLSIEKQIDLCQENRNFLALFDDEIKTRVDVLGGVYQFPDFIQDEFYQFKNEILTQRLEIIGLGGLPPVIEFSISFIEKKFKELYGEEKWNMYSSLFANLSFIDTNNALFSLINGKNSIVLKNDPSKVVPFFQLMLKKNKTVEENAVLYNEFYDLVGDTYGKSALSFLRERPGLNYEDISNIEIFSPNVLNNFRRGFIDDLLSYEFGGYFDQLIEISKNEEELKSFKLLYDRFSLKFGENVETMLLTFSRYDKYQSILKEFVEKNISSEEDLKKLDALCTWPGNITKVEHISQLENLEENLSLALENNGTSHLMENSFFDYQLFSNFDGFNSLFDIKAYATKNMDKLDKNSLLFIKLFDENKNFTFTPEELSREITGFLSEYKREGGNLSSFFQTMYQLMNDIREENENYFRNHVVTDRKYIDKKIEEHADNVHKISVCGVELYDLGDMEVNFACHSYNMANSVDQIFLPTLQKEYLGYDGQRGISTISARPIHGIWGSDGSGHDKSSNYIFWDFSDNHVMSLFSTNGISDGVVAHQSKIIMSRGGSNLALNNFQNVTSGKGEIAFYRRKRNHMAIESQKYGGKIIPDAISGGVSSWNLDLANGRFGKKIPILLQRGSLRSEKEREFVRKQVISTFIQMDRENSQLGNDVNYHVPDNLKEIVSQELSTFSQDFLDNLWLYKITETNLADVRYYELLKSYELERTNQIEMNGTYSR